MRDTCSVIEEFKGSQLPQQLDNMMVTRGGRVVDELEKGMALRILTRSSSYSASAANLPRGSTISPIQLIGAMRTVYLVLSA